MKHRFEPVVMAVLLLGASVVHAWDWFVRPDDWGEALNLLRQNPECKAGARPVKLEVHFNP